MIHEYALDPAVLLVWASNYRDYAEFMREYGLGTPRIISSFPKKKASKLKSYFLRRGPEDSESLQGRRYLEMVVKMTDVLILRESHQPEDPDWYEITKVENERVQFDVVLSSEAIDTERNITPVTMYSQSSIWSHPRQKNISRTIAGFSATVKNLLRLATEQVVIVDAYGWTQEAVTAMQYFIKFIREDRVNGKLPNIVLYYKEKRGGANAGGGSPCAAHVKQKILEGVTPGLSDIQLQVFEVQETAGKDVFHNRCILTEHGGVITGHGIGISGHEEHTDEAILMEPEIYEKKWKQFVPVSCFKVVSRS